MQQRQRQQLQHEQYTSEYDNSSSKTSHQQHEQYTSEFDGTTTSTSTATNLFDEQNLENFEALSAFDMELTKLQALNAVTLLQAQQQRVPFLQNLLQTYNTINQLQNWQLQQNQQQQQQLSQVPPILGNGSNSNGSNGLGNNSLNLNSSDAYLDRVAKFYRGSAAFCEPTCTWSGQLPPRSHRLYQFSPKVFLGGIPWDISEQSLIQIFKPFGQIK